MISCQARFMFCTYWSVRHHRYLKDDRCSFEFSC